MGGGERQNEQSCTKLRVVLPARPGFNEQSCWGCVRTYQGNSSVLGGWEDRERGTGRAETQKGEVLAALCWLLGSQADFLLFPEIWNMQPLRVSSGCDLGLEGPAGSLSPCPAPAALAPHRHHQCHWLLLGKGAQ